MIISFKTLIKKYLVIYFSVKIIITKPKYKTYDSELLAIIKAFKTW